MGVEHLTRWKRIMLVTDVEWMIHLTTLFGWATPASSGIPVVRARRRLRLGCRGLTHVNGRCRVR